jgi:integrase
VTDLLDSYLQSLRDRGKKAIHSAELRAGLLRSELGQIRSAALAIPHLEEYRRIRARQGAGEVTIDRDLQLLRAAFRLAQKQGRVLRVPFFPISGRDNVRLGFFESGEADAVEKELGGVLAEVFRFARFSGWRISEVLALRWEWINREGREVTLPTSKNGRPRSLYLFGELWSVIERRRAARPFNTRRGVALSPFVFHRGRGYRISYSWLRKDFVAACERAAVQGRTLHDLRRTAARELRRAGVPETVCMSITGHVSSSMFRRYSIADSRDQADALKVREALLAAEQGNYRTTTPFPTTPNAAETIEK